MSVVLDASVLSEVLLMTPKGRAAEPVLRSHTVHVPELIFVEVVSVFRRWARCHSVAQARANQALEDLAVFPARRWPHAPLLSRVWQLKDNMSAYDATYVALAEVMGLPLVTADAALVRAIRSVGACTTIEID